MAAYFPKCMFSDLGSENLIFSKSSLVSEYQHHLCHTSGAENNRKIQRGTGGEKEFAEDENKDRGRL